MITIGKYRNEEAAKHVAAIVQKAVGKDATVRAKRLDLMDNYAVQATIYSEQRLSERTLEDIADLAYRIHNLLK